MFCIDDLEIICCPICKSDLDLINENLICRGCKSNFPIIEGIPRLLNYSIINEKYYKTWDYKWLILDDGKGYNFQILDPKNPAYNIHNVFQYCEYDGESFKDIINGIVIDVGCGIGQYTIKLLEKGAKRVYAVDISRSVDIGNKIFKERYPEFSNKVVFIQANALFLPIKTESIDLVFALATLHHSGNIENCLKEIIRTLKSGKRFVAWIYAKQLMPINDENRDIKGFIKILIFMYRILQVELYFNITRRLPNFLRVIILRIIASNFVYYLINLPIAGKIINLLLPPGINKHPDKGYRLINLYDAYSPSFSEASDECDIIQWSKKCNFTILNFSSWRLGFLGMKNLKI